LSALWRCEVSAISSWDEAHASAKGLALAVRSSTQQKGGKMTLRVVLWCGGAGACIGCALTRSDFGVCWAAGWLFVLATFELRRAYLQAPRGPKIW